MRIVIDTNKQRIIVPQSFFSQVEKVNKILADSGSNKKWGFEEYIKDQFNKAIEKPLVRPGDKQD